MRIHVSSLARFSIVGGKGSCSGCAGGAVWSGQPQGAVCGPLVVVALTEGVVVTLGKVWGMMPGSFMAVWDRQRPWMFLAT